jgi:hypothetical protein
LEAAIFSVHHEYPEKVIPAQAGIPVCFRASQRKWGEQRQWRGSRLRGNDVRKPALYAGIVFFSKKYDDRHI